MKRLLAPLVFIFSIVCTAVSAQAPPDEQVYFMADKMPAFEGGDVMAFRRWVMGQIEYPEKAIKQNIEGQVTATFIVEKDGMVAGVEILSSPSPLLSDEVVRVISSSPRWVPGEIGEKVVNVKITIPVDFRLQAAEEREEELPESKLAKEKDVVPFAQQMPRFRYGNQDGFRQWVTERLEYPENVPADFEVTDVIMAYIVETDGSVRRTEVLKSGHPALAAEVERVVLSSPKWQPGMNKRKPVPVVHMLETDFAIVRSIHRAVDGTVYTTGQDEDGEYHIIAEKMPEFQGGGLDRFRAWVISRIEYPRHLYDRKIEGLVRVSFIIDATGSVSNIKIVESPSAYPSFSEEVIRVLNLSPKWTPGEQGRQQEDGTFRMEPVRVRFTLPIHFRL